MIDLPLVTILLLTGFINLIGALAYAARIAGVRTRRIAMSFALFNILVLFSRTSNSFLGPFLAKRIETRLHDGSGASLFIDMQLVLAAASVATLIGILLVPTGQRMFAAAIGWYQTNRSTTKLAVKAVSPSGLRTLGRSLTLPSLAHLKSWKMPQGDQLGRADRQLPRAIAARRRRRRVALRRLSRARVPRHRVAAVGADQRVRDDPALRLHRPATVGDDRRCGRGQSRRGASSAARSPSSR